MTARYRSALPQLAGDLFLTDGGIGTTLIFHDGLELPDFAAFYMLRTDEGRAALLRYFRTYAAIAKRFDTGLILESATWRAGRDWATRLGYSREALADANRAAVAMLEPLRDDGEAGPGPERTVVSGCVGPRGDGYVPNTAMTPEQAEDYHAEQVTTFADTSADMVCALTLNYVEEAIGVARAARRAKMPVAISFTVETDGRLPTGQPLGRAIEQVDEATSGYPAYFMINCAHPSHFDELLADAARASDGAWLGRIRGLRANASRKSHAELNESSDLDIGNPAELGADYARLRQRLTNLNVMGGCCGTDHRHIEQIGEACVPLFR